MRPDALCSHMLPTPRCDQCYPRFLAETTVGDVLDADKANGKSQAWRDAADKLLEALARDNRYIVADMMQIFLESAGYGLLDYSPLGGVFKRAAKKGVVSRIARPTKQALWYSNIYRTRSGL